MTESNKKSIDIYAIVTNRIIEHLEKGVIPWRQPWTEAGAPRNLVTGKPYRGINYLLLGSLGYKQNCFLTFNQAKELGATVRKGEKSLPVVFWKWIEKENKQTKEIEKVPLLRYYNVFNVSQCDDIPKEKLPAIVERVHDPIQTCEEIIAKMPKRPEIRHTEHRAYYNVQADYVNTPEPETFVDAATYYGTLFHELIHATGHENRLNRKELIEQTRFGSETYSIEELTAEIGASFLKSQAGLPIEHIEESAAYINGWLGKLKDDKRFIVYASAQAQKATDFILKTKEREQETEKELNVLPTNRAPQRGEELQHYRNKTKRNEYQKDR